MYIFFEIPTRATFRHGAPVLCGVRKNVVDSRKNNVNPFRVLRKKGNELEKPRVEKHTDAVVLPPPPPSESKKPLPTRTPVACALDRPLGRIRGVCAREGAPVPRQSHAGQSSYSHTRTPGTARVFAGHLSSRRLRALSCADNTCVPRSFRHRRPRHRL